MDTVKNLRRSIIAAIPTALFGIALLLPAIQQVRGV